jgi:hypothetical protein
MALVERFIQNAGVERQPGKFAIDKTVRRLNIDHARALIANMRPDGIIG